MDYLIFYFIFCIFLKNRRIEVSFHCRNEFCMTKYPNNLIFILCNFALTIVFWRLAKKLINTILAEFDFFPSKNHDSIVFYFASNFQRESPKIENNDYQIFYFYFLHFSQKPQEVFSAEMNSACQNTLVTAFLWDLEKKKRFFPTIWRLWAKKIDQYLSAEFGVFPSKNHDSIVFMQFCQ